jgi:lipopolysaccharide export system protein LptA
MSSTNCGQTRWSFPGALGTLVSLGLLALLAGPVQALQTDKDQPIMVEADSVEINDATGVSTYQGNVIIRQGSIKIQADKVQVHQARGDARKVIADGSPVKFEQQPDEGKLVRGEARRAEYEMDGEILYLIGEAELHQGNDSFRSDRITYDRGRAMVKAGASAEGKERVRMTIEPNR